MAHPLLDVARIDQPPAAYLKSVGRVFAVYGEATQDSGNVSYGVQIGQERYFVKTAGEPQVKAYFDHAARVELLHNAVRLYESCPDPPLSRLHGVVDSPHGPLLVYDWCSGELLRAPAAQRQDPATAHQRFRRLSPEQVTGALDAVYEAHVRLAAAGWIAVDFYDGSMMYDFDQQQVFLIDLDHYHRGPFVNQMGRMFGSTRFMAPEEFEKSALIDQRTTVFVLARAAAVFLADGSLERGPFRGGEALYEVVCRACQPAREQRFAGVADFYRAWQAAFI